MTAHQPATDGRRGLSLRVAIPRLGRRVAPFSLLTLLALSPIDVAATTWDEPWMDKVISDAASFVRVTVVAHRTNEVELKVTRHLAGTATPSDIKLVGYSLLSMGSAFLPETELPFQAGSDYYLFLEQADQGAGYRIATPTTGWAAVTGDGVFATYRHSYHKALVPEEVYELTMTAIFNRSHGIQGDETPARRFVSAELSQRPAVLTETAEVKGQVQFFRQHAALETFRYLGSEQELALIDPFLETDDFHVQVSAVRALAGVRSEAASRKLMGFIEAERHGFAKVMAVWGLREQGAKDMLPRLRRFVSSGKDEETGFGGNLMDPRIGTRFPRSVKEAVEDLVESWGG